jgi:hypothetical protein
LLQNKLSLLHDTRGYVHAQALDSPREKMEGSAIVHSIGDMGGEGNEAEAGRKRNQNFFRVDPPQENY